MTHDGVENESPVNTGAFPDPKLTIEYDDTFIVAKYPMEWKATTDIHIDYDRMLAQLYAHNIDWQSKGFKRAPSPCIAVRDAREAQRKAEIEAETCSECGYNSYYD